MPYTIKTNFVMSLRRTAKTILFMSFICAFLDISECFNLEHRLPVYKRGSVDSYFGFSVAEHQVVADDGTKENWLLVGAPKDQNMQPGTNKSGALWRCPVSTLVGDCEQVVTDGRRAKGGQYDKSIDSNELSRPHPDEIKDGQWLGVSVKSQGIGGKVSVCAHRYIRKIGNESEFGQGLCYTLSNDLEYDENHQPCQGRPINKGHEEYGYCQVGTSSSFLEDGTLILGSPGPYTWRGTVFVQDTNDAFLERDKTTYNAPVLDGPVDKYSYLGMSVAGGYFFGPKTSYVAGAPRSNGTGQVILFSKQIGAKTLNVNEPIINGEQFASNFGYEISALDLNGDGKTDIVVGAPFYFSRNAGGSVYVYMNNNYSFKSKYDIKLTGKPESRFGFALSSAGDLNKDGCDDLAIGSPYEGLGVVYIYLGNRKDGLDKEPKQIIRSEMLPIPNLRTFGYSLSGGTDLDGNNYPDLLTGAYEKDSVILLRARPIIDIKTYLKSHEPLKKIDPSKHGCPRDPYSNHTCFSFEICCAIEALHKLSRVDTLMLNYVIEAETFSGLKKFSRVYFGGMPGGIKTNILRRDIELKKTASSRCQEHTVYIKENTRDIQSPIKFHVNYTLVQNKPVWMSSGPLPSVDKLPVLNATHAVLTFDALLLRDCGDDDICESEIVVGAELMLPSAEGKEKEYILPLGQESEVRLSVSVDNFGEAAYEPQLYISHHPDLNYIAAKTVDKYVICNVFSKDLIVCSLENPFKRQKPGENTIILRFDPKSLDLEKSIKFEIWVNTTSRNILPIKPVTVEALVVKNAELTVKGSARPEQVFYGGDVKGESAMKSLDDIGTKILHVYQVFNLGPWRVNYAEVVIEWPHQIANNKAQGKWLLYLESQPEIEGGEGCLVDKSYINPLNLPTNQSTLESNSINQSSRRTNRPNSISQNLKSRKKRDSEMIVKPEAYVDTDGTRRQIINMDCQLGTAKCIKIRCKIYSLAQNQEATIRIHARLWNSSLVEDYPSVQYVSTTSRATLILPPNLNIRQNNTDDDIAVVQTKAYPDLVIREEPNYMLYIILAIVLGIIVLILIIILLWKFGFFKRRRLDMTLSGNIEKNENSPFLGKSS